MIRRLIAAALTTALLLTVASPVAARGGASITAPDGLAFGQQFVPTWTAPNHSNGSLYARVDCSQPGSIMVYAEMRNLDGGVPGDLGPFTLGPTPRWSGGPASCVIRMWLFDGSRYRGPLAEDAFEVSG